MSQAKRGRLKILHKQGRLIVQKNHGTYATRATPKHWMEKVQKPAYTRHKGLLEIFSFAEKN